MKYIRDHYKVPAKRGMRVAFTAWGGRSEGVIVGASGARLRVRIDGMRRALNIHPTWQVEYLP